jgi:4'-phosphopantetheinyl transferase
MEVRPRQLDSVSVWLSRAERDQRQVARELIIRAVATTLDTPSERVTVDSEPTGRPVVRVAGHDDGLHIALSHTRGFVAVALTGLGPVGVDAETVRPLPALALAHRWLSADEAQWLAAQPAAAHTAGFLLLWTQKEAVGKALGVGLRGGGLRRPMPPQSRQVTVPVSLTEQRDSVEALAAGPFRPVPGLPTMAVAGLPLADGLVLAVACDAAGAIGAPIVIHGLGVAA